MWSSWNLSPGEIFVVNERVEVGVEGREIIHALLYLVRFLPLPLPVGPRDLGDDGRHDYLVFTQGKLPPSNNDQSVFDPRNIEYFDVSSHFMIHLIDNVLEKLKVQLYRFLDITTLHPSF